MYTLRTPCIMMRSVNKCAIKKHTIFQAISNERTQFFARRQHNGQCCCGKIRGSDNLNVAGYVSAGLTDCSDGSAHNITSLETCVTIPPRGK